MNSSTAHEPRLSVIHLLGWTACTAIVLVLNRQYEHGQPQLNLWFFVGDLPDAMAYGAAFESLLIMASRHWRRLTFPSQPGEWILVSLALYRINGYLWISQFEDLLHT